MEVQIAEQGCSVEKDRGSGRSAKLRAGATHAGIQRAGLVGKTVRKET